ncbi:hypothetical protein AKJ09_00455 [Labilithrix luteola]|uniref:DUF7793 domain-containing protein n=1 Tax=Labilithrix luteola TaxID=1391654 RepID=A0A0K1PK74_9BACT|nr:hypothetical protein [Labilithrix luteola]AKU93791.1 hypothetical protein AKJ09_00455 [Labilithrix luteola]
MIPVDQWQHLGSSSNAEFYLVETEILAVVPYERCEDNEKTARESLAFQTAHWRSVGHRGAAIIFMDRVLVQDGGARTVYEEESHGLLTTCFALVGETFFGRVTASVYTGLKKPAIPTQVFRSLEDALPWIRETNRVRGGRI